MEHVNDVLAAAIHSWFRRSSGKCCPSWRSTCLRAGSPRSPCTTRTAAAISSDYRCNAIRRSVFDVLLQNELSVMPKICMNYLTVVETCRANIN